MREPNEWATGHVPGARLVPLGQLRADLDAAKLGKKVLFVCAGGGRSLTAAKLAEVSGVAEVYSLDGGTSGWSGRRPPDRRPRARPSPVQASAEAAAPAEAGAEEGDPGARRRRRPEREASSATARGLTLDLLAGLSGVGRQALGQIEIGRTRSERRHTLEDRARVRRAVLCAARAALAPVRPRCSASATAKRLVSADGRFSSRALYAPGDGGKVEFYELLLAGHAREDAEAHAPGTRENLVVTAGRLRLEVGAERFELVKGDAIAFTADLPHAYVNPGSEECWMNLVMTYQA